MAAGIAGERVVAAARERVAGGGRRAHLEADGRHDRLESGTGRIQPPDGAVVQGRASGGRVEVLPDERGVADGEGVEVELGKAGLGHDGARVGVEDDGGPAGGQKVLQLVLVVDAAGRGQPFGEGVLGRPLHLGVEGEGEVVAPHRRLVAERGAPDGVAQRVDLDLADSLLAVEQALVLLLDPAPADDVARLEGRIALDVVGAGLAQVADHVRGEGARRAGRVTAQ